MKSRNSDSRSPRRGASGTSLPDSLAAGFLAGALGGLVFLAVGLARDGADFLAYWPTAAFALWLFARSVAVYGLVFGAAGLVMACALHLVLRHGRAPIRRRCGDPIFLLVLGGWSRSRCSPT